MIILDTNIIIRIIHSKINLSDIRKLIQEEMDEYSLWEWLAVPIKECRISHLNKLGKEGWKFAFTSDIAVCLQRIKK